MPRQAQCIRALQPRHAQCDGVFHQAALTALKYASHDVTAWMQILRNGEKPTIHDFRMEGVAIYGQLGKTRRCCVGQGATIIAAGLGNHERLPQQVHASIVWPDRALSHRRRDARRLGNNVVPGRIIETGGRPPWRGCAASR